MNLKLESLRNWWESNFFKDYILNLIFLNDRWSNLSSFMSFFLVLLAWISLFRYFILIGIPENAFVKCKILIKLQVHTHMYSKVYSCLLRYQMVSKAEKLVAQSCLTLCDPVDCSLLGLSVHGILHARIMEWVAISFSSQKQTRN